MPGVNRGAPDLQLNSQDRAMLGGEAGAAAAMAMRLIVGASKVLRAERLLDITSAHIDGCLYHGAASLDFVDRLVEGGGRVRVPTTLNVGSIDLIHPELFRGEAALASAGRRLMDAHVRLGCEPTFTCAPYQLKHRPKFGEQIAWAESNAIVFANSVLGARTHRYGDFIDLAAAITGRAPACGLHLDENRLAQLVLHVRGFPAARGERDVWYATLGLVLGRIAGSRVAAITGLPSDTNEDELKALGAAAASTGAVGLFHAVGITPEAPTLGHVLRPGTSVHTQDIELADLRAMRREVSSARAGDVLTAVAIGTPHFSLAEFRSLDVLLRGEAGVLAADFYVNTSRFILEQIEAEGIAARLRERGLQIVTDTCTYISPVMRRASGLVMTNSGKWAMYAPGNLGVGVAYGSLRECVRSAVRGKVVFDE
jgi:predicted aconitase